MRDAFIGEQKEPKTYRNASGYNNKYSVAEGEGFEPTRARSSYQS